MLSTVKRVLVIAAVATAGVAASAGTAHASTAVRVTSGVGSVALTTPTTNVEGTGSALKWVPATIRAKAVAGTCSSTNHSFLIVNKTKANQQVEYSGGALGAPIPPKNGLYVCASGAIKTTFWLKADKAAKLKVNIT
jgi:hypothetical protein